MNAMRSNELASCSNQIGKCIPGPWGFCLCIWGGPVWLSAILEVLCSSSLDRADGQSLVLLFPQQIDASSNLALGSIQTVSLSLLQDGARRARNPTNLNSLLCSGRARSPWKVPSASPLYLARVQLSDRPTSDLNKFEKYVKFWKQFCTDLIKETTKHCSAGVENVWKLIEGSRWL